MIRQSLLHQRRCLFDFNGIAMAGLSGHLPDIAGYYVPGFQDNSGIGAEGQARCNNCTAASHFQ